MSIGTIVAPETAQQLPSPGPRTIACGHRTSPVYGGYYADCIAQELQETGPTSVWGIKKRIRSGGRFGCVTWLRAGRVASAVTWRACSPWVYGGRALGVCQFRCQVRLHKS